MKEIQAAAKVAHDILKEVSVLAADSAKVLEVFQCLELIHKLSTPEEEKKEEEEKPIVAEVAEGEAV